MLSSETIPWPRLSLITGLLVNSGSWPMVKGRIFSDPLFAYHMVAVQASEVCDKRDNKQTVKERDKKQSTVLRLLYDLSDRNERNYKSLASKPYFFICIFDWTRWQGWMRQDPVLYDNMSKFSLSSLFSPSIHNRTKSLISSFHHCTTLHFRIKNTTVYSSEN